MLLKKPCEHLQKFRQAFHQHKMNIAATNVLYNTMILLNKKHTLVDRDSYQGVFQTALNDIEMKSSPMELIIPTFNEKGKMFKINHSSDEWIKISDRVTIEWIEELAGSGSGLVCLLKVEPQKISIVREDLFIYYVFFKCLDQIDIVRVDNFSNYTEVIEYVVNNITFDDWKDFIKTDKPNEDKYAKKCEDLIFNPDIVSIQKFYMNNEDDDVPKFDVVNLIMRLTTNQVIKNDMIFILAVYLTISFAMADFNNKRVEESPCAKYVRDVLSKL